MLSKLCCDVGWGAAGCGSTCAELLPCNCRTSSIAQDFSFPNPSQADLWYFTSIHSTLTSIASTWPCLYANSNPISHHALSCSIEWDSHHSLSNFFQNLSQTLISSASTWTLLARQFPFNLPSWTKLMEYASFLTQFLPKPQPDLNLIRFYTSLLVRQSLPLCHHALSCPMSFCSLQWNTHHSLSNFFRTLCHINSSPLSPQPREPNSPPLLYQHAPIPDNFHTKHLSIPLLSWIKHTRLQSPHQ